MLGDPQPARLEELVPGVRVKGVRPSGPVEVVAAKWMGSNALVLTYVDSLGTTRQAVLSRDKESQLTIVPRGRTRGFDGDAREWRLAAEAMRMRDAALFDRMIAVSTSALQPLPHQLRAVYGDMLPRTPLRFLLADDPGAGKTVMAGLYIKELMLRGELARCLVVAPGSLVEQWQGELLEKFGLRFEILTRSLVEASVENPFDEHPLLIARMDQLARNQDLGADLEKTAWDLVVVDEAHRMSASYSGGSLSTTKRYQLGKALGRLTRHLLLMTATPHAGKQDEFQLFLALLDEDRFEGRPRPDAPPVEPGELMRRMIKEELLTMDGKPLFPERRAYTVDYELTEAERDLYQAVTEYVRQGMDRARRLKAAGEGRRGSTVGFALTVLQRRLASSPEAILRSLERRQARLEKRLRAMASAIGGDDRELSAHLSGLIGGEAEIVDRLGDLLPREIEELEDAVADAATAARTAAELELEIEELRSLVILARGVRASGRDRKWTELSRILTGNELTRQPDGTLRKMIIFTEHRDTLNYLVHGIGTLLGRPDAVVAIHGGIGHQSRRGVQARFTSDPLVQVLVATDAAGEGLNLQRAHLMVNYDLPWNPNRIEQRFGRIHRIGQTEVCHLWNLVARGTREGDVFLRLLTKLEQQSVAYQGKVFDILGEAFAEESLRDLLVRAIEYGDRPEVRAHLETVIDKAVSVGIPQLVAERALYSDRLSIADVEAVRLGSEDAEGLALQPYHVEAFFLAAFKALGGVAVSRGSGLFEITSVPSELREFAAGSGRRAPLPRRYERVTFDRGLAERAAGGTVEVLTPGHPLFEAVVGATVDRRGRVLKQGTVLVDPTDEGDEPRLLVAFSHEITDGHDPARLVSRRVQFVELGPRGVARATGSAPYLDLVPPVAEDQGAVEAVLEGTWLEGGAEELATTWMVTDAVPHHERAVLAQVAASVGRVRREVTARLSSEIQYSDRLAQQLRADEAAGRSVNRRPETEERRARDLERRLQRRLAELDRDEQLSVLPPTLEGAAVVVPKGLVRRAVSGSLVERAADRARAVALVMDVERALGRFPEGVSDGACGYDVKSRPAGGGSVRVKVARREESARDLIVRRTDAIAGRLLGESFRLALVVNDSVRYVRNPFDGFGSEDFSAASFRLPWAVLMSVAEQPW